MTSEIAVMNQRAVALAADSAVTVFDRGRVSVRTDQRKLFQLAEGVPVGTMFFGLADLMGQPWDVLLNYYASTDRPGALASVSAHAERMLASLDHVESFFPPTQQMDEYRRLLASVYRFVLRFAHYLREIGTDGPDEEILRQAIAMVWRRYQNLDDGAPRPDLDCFPKNFGATIARDNARAVDELIAFAFSSFVLDRTTRQYLRDIAEFCVSKDLFLEDVTGLVFAGYGKADNFPVVATYNVSAVVGGIVKRARADETRIDSQMRSAVTLFADSEATYAFLRGIELDLEMRFYGIMQAMGGALVDEMAAAFSNVDPAFRESVRRRFHTERVPQVLQRCYDVLSEYQQDALVNPILAALEIASRQELADTAEHLVNLNIFKKKIMAQTQTVGGAVDVAVISRDRGFCWVKRQEA